MNTHIVRIGVRPVVLGLLLMAQASSSAFDAHWAGGSGNWVGINWTPQPLDFTLELGVPVPWPTWPDNVRSSTFGSGYEYEVRIGGGSVSLDAPMTISGLDVGGSGELEINTGGILTLSELAVGSGGVVENDGRIRLDGAGILTGAGLLLQGFGRTEFADENAQIATAVLAIAAGHTVQGRGQVNAAAVENDGIILGNWPGSTLKFVGASLDNRDRIIGTNSGKVTIEVDSLDNDQLIAADGGDVKLEKGAFTNDGLLRASAGGRLEISDATLNNNGHTIDAHPSSFVDFRNDATLEGGLLRSFGNGVFRLTDGPVTFTGGIVKQGFVSGVAASLNFLNAQLDNTAGVLEINAPAVAGAATPFTLIGGRLQGNGTAGFSAPLTLEGGPGGLTLGGPSVLVLGAPLHLGGVVSNHALVILTNAVLVAQSNAVLHGGGQVLLQPPPAGQQQNASKLIAGASTVLSNGPGHTILGTFLVSTGSLDLVNVGTLASTETQAGLFTHFDLRGRSVTNLGLIEARPAAQLTLDTGTYRNEGGTIRSGSNATVTLANNPVVRGGRLDGTGTFQNTGFTVLDGQGTPVTLAEARFLTGSDRTTYLQGTLTLENGAVDIQDIYGGVGSPNAQLAASGAARIDGTGTLRFLQPLNVNGLAGNRLVGADAASSLTLEPGVLFDTPTNGSGIVTVRLNNEGTVRSSGSVDFWSRSNVNNGTLTAASGGRLALTGDTADGTALDNTGGTLHAEAGGQMLYGALARPIHLRGGRLTGPGTHLGSYSVTLDGTGEALRIENATLRLGPTTVGYLAGRLTLNGGTLLLDDTASACCGNDTWLHVQPGAVIDGSGTLLFGFDNPALASDAENNLAGSTLSVGAGVSLLTTNQGNGTIACGLLNAGLVHAAAGKLLLTGTNHLNNGEYRASGGGTMTLALGNQTTVISNHQGRFTTDSTGRIVFGDTYYFSSGTRILGGELSGPGLFDLAGSVELNGAASPVLFGQGTMRLAQNTALYLVGGLAMDGSTIQLRNPGGFGVQPSSLVASGPVAITGPGLIEFSTPHNRASVISSWSGE
jgi:hypothetical protein